MNRRGFLRMLGMAPAAAVAVAVPGAFAAGPQRFHTGGFVTLNAAEAPVIMQPGEFVWHKRITIPAFNWKRLSGWPVYDPRE